MAALVPYVFEGRTLHSFDHAGETLFLAGDAAGFLGHASAKDLTRNLDYDEKGRHSVPTLGGEQDVLVITEAGLYRAIVQRRATSTIPADIREFIARFQRWVFHDVLPSIRRTSSYSPPLSVDLDARKTREARLLHKHLLGIGKMAGLQGNQLLYAANRATKRETGFDVLGSMGITHLIAPVNDPLVIPTKLGQDLGGLRAVQVNRMIRNMDLQVQVRDHKQRVMWVATPKGESLGATLVDTDRDNETGSAQQLKWPLAATLELLRAYMESKGADDAPEESA